MGPKADDKHRKRQEEGRRHREKRTRRCEGRDGGGRHAASSKKGLEAAQLAEAGKGSLIEAWGHLGPANILISDLWFPELWGKKKYISVL